MSRVEFPPYSEGEKGLIVDEAYNEFRHESFLDVSIFDDEGMMVFYTDFDRDATPEDIAELLESEAADIVNHPPDGLLQKNAEKISEMFMREVRKLRDADNPIV